MLKVLLNGAHRTAAEQTNPTAKLRKETDALDVRIQGFQEEGSHERPGRTARAVTAALCKRSQARATRREAGRCGGGVGDRDASRVTALGSNTALFGEGVGVERHKRDPVEARLAEAIGSTDESVQEAESAGGNAASQSRELRNEVWSTLRALKQAKSHGKDADL